MLSDDALARVDDVIIDLDGRAGDKWGGREACIAIEGSMSLEVCGRFS
jgi:hypothetical protein